MKPTQLFALFATGALLLGGQVQAADTDDRIEDAAKKSYVYRTYLADDHIKVDSKNGVVTLSGTVADESHKRLAEDTVRGLPGVREVVNNLKTRDEKPAASDDWLSAKVKATLLFHRSVSGKDTQVFAKDGVITLRGTASSQAQKDLTTEYARDVEGVKDVKNEMTIAPNPGSDRTIGEKIDDASITAQLKAALLTHRSTSALRTNVETKDGVVTITGTAKNQAEKDLVTKLAKDINGVKDVRNEMTIAG